ncbi:amidohydrolase family protein [Paraburkholderia sp. GAS334]|uniref:amidohydrolase family protein n=1 Tax=Paraburkholderia sp. GAS334 TaxID=3035131 RepID=UPI003D1F8845
MLHDDIFIFDNAVHMYDLSDENVSRSDGILDRGVHLKIAQLRRPKGQEKLYGNGDPIAGFARQWGVEDLGRLLFEDSCTDMAMAQAVVLYDVYKKGFAPVEAQYEFARAHPDRVLFCGGVDPLYPSVDGALREMERQVRELGARSFKFYNAHLGKSWGCDDPKLAYPLYEKARELGIKVLQFHKGFPITRARLEDLSPLDIQQAALDFPDLTFAIHHLALPYFEEVVYIAARFPNVVLVLSGTMHLPLVAPWQFMEYMGRLLRDVGSSRLIWGSEAPLLGNPQPMIEWFWNMQIDPELQARYGYPQITEEDKRNILGENQARLFGVDVNLAKQQARARRASS